jgi:hypothetical protein
MGQATEKNLSEAVRFISSTSRAAQLRCASSAHAVQENVTPTPGKSTWRLAMSHWFDSRATADDSIESHVAPARVEPAEARTFSIVELLVLVVGFAVAAALVARTERWNAAPPDLLLFGLTAHAAIGLGLSGPIVVSWRERLGRRRPIWGLGESLWFATGMLVQIIVITYFVFDRLERSGSLHVAAFVPLVLVVALPMIYLTGNPRIELRRAPGSWSNVVGLASVTLWGLTLWMASRL